MSAARWHIQRADVPLLALSLLPAADNAMEMDQLYGTRRLPPPAGLQLGDSPLPHEHGAPVRESELA